MTKTRWYKADRRRRRHVRANRLCLERLEYRAMLAGDVVAVGPVTTDPLDVNGDGVVSPADALAIVNQLNQPAEGEMSVLSLDVNGDHAVTPLDALMVIDRLNTDAAAALESQQTIYASQSTDNGGIVDLPSSPISKTDEVIDAALDDDYSTTIALPDEVCTPPADASIAISATPDTDGNIQLAVADELEWHPDQQIMLDLEGPQVADPACDEPVTSIGDEGPISDTQSTQPTDDQPTSDPSADASTDETDSTTPAETPSDGSDGIEVIVVGSENHESSGTCTDVIVVHDPIPGPDVSLPPIIVLADHSETPESDSGTQSGDDQQTTVENSDDGSVEGPIQVTTQDGTSVDVPWDLESLEIPCQLPAGIHLELAQQISPELVELAQNWFHQQDAAFQEAAVNEFHAWQDHVNTACADGHVTWTEVGSLPVNDLVSLVEQVPLPTFVTEELTHLQEIAQYLASPRVQQVLSWISNWGAA